MLNNILFLDSCMLHHQKTIVLVYYFDYYKMILMFLECMQCVFIPCFFAF